MGIQNKDTKAALWRKTTENEIAHLDRRLENKIFEAKQAQVGHSALVKKRNRLVKELNIFKYNMGIEITNEEKENLVLEEPTELVAILPDSPQVSDIPQNNVAAISEGTTTTVVLETPPVPVPVIKPKVYSDLEIAKKLIWLSTSAESRNLKFNLDFKTVKRLMHTKKCYFTGIDLIASPLRDNSRTIDRLDNTKGYEIGNVVACSKWFNEVKGSLTIEQFLILQKGFKKAKLIK